MVTNKVKVCHSSNTNQNSTQYSFNENLNVDFLTKTYIDNLPFCEKMFSIFLSTIATDMSNLEAAIATQDFETIAGVAHKIKNNFTWVGLPKMSKMMYSLENLARDNDSALVDSYQELIDCYESELNYVESQYSNLKAYVSK